MNRGSETVARRPSADCHCFNEAPIHESGKSRPDCTQGTITDCFNEAPIHESGKFGMGVAYAGLVCIALQ